MFGFGRKHGSCAFIIHDASRLPFMSWPTRESSPLIPRITYEPAACWQRLQAAKGEFFFEDLDQLMKDRHRQFLEELMGYERQCFINAHPYERTEQRVT